MMQPQTRTVPGFMERSVPARVACRAGTVAMQKAQLGRKFFHLRKVAREDALAQRLDRLGSREAAPPGDADAARRHRPRERQDADQLARAAARAGGGRRQHRDADAARHHLAYGLERAALERPCERASLLRSHGMADLEHLVAEAVP